MRVIWAKNTTTEFQNNAYHDNPSFSDFEDLLAPKKKRVNLHDTKSAAWKALATILPKATPLPALGSLPQHPVFAERTKYTNSEERKDATPVSRKHLEFFTNLTESQTRFLGS